MFCRVCGVHRRFTPERKLFEHLTDLLCWSCLSWAKLGHLTPPRR